MMQDRVVSAAVFRIEGQVLVAEEVEDALISWGLHDFENGELREDDAVHCWCR